MRKVQADPNISSQEKMSSLYNSEEKDQYNNKQQEMSFLNDNKNSKGCHKHTDSKTFLKTNIDISNTMPQSPETSIRSNTSRNRKEDQIKQNQPNVIKNIIKNTNKLRQGSLTKGSNPGTPYHNKTSKMKKNSVLSLNNNGEPDYMSGLMNAIRKNFETAKELGRMEFIKKRMMQLLSMTESRKFLSLEQTHYEILNDRAIYLQDTQQSFSITQKIAIFFKKIDWVLAKMCKSFKTYHPFHFVNFYLQILEVLSIICCLLYYSLLIFFDYFEEDFNFYFNIVTLVIFVFNMYMRINTAYADQGMLVYNKAQIIYRYRNGLMVYDLLGLFSIIYMLCVQDHTTLTKIFCSFVFLKTKISTENLSNIEERLNLSGNMVHVWTLFILLGQALALCHFVGTAYFFLAKIEIESFDEKNSWVQLAALEEESPLFQYLQAYYWALATIMLVGSKGETQIETLFCITVLICTVGMFATILSSVAQVMENIEEKKKFYKKDKEMMNTFFSIQNISLDLQGQLHNYLKYSYEGHKEKLTNTGFEKLMIDTFPEDLRDMVRDERYNSQIDNFTLLCEKFSKKSQNELIHFVQEEYYMPNQIIFQREVYEEPKIYLILKGEVEIYQETGEVDSILHVIKQGEYFGENTFFTNAVPFYGARSRENQFTTLLVITRTAFLDIIQDNEEDKEKFQTIKDQMILMGHSSVLGQECLICHDKYHNESQCGLINYYPNPINIAMKISHCQNQERRDMDTIENQEYGKIKKIPKQRKFTASNITQGGNNLGSNNNKQKLQHSWLSLKQITEKSQDILDNPDMRKFFKPIQEIQKKIAEQQLEEEEEEDEYEDEDEDEEYTEYNEEEGEYQSGVSEEYQDKFENNDMPNSERNIEEMQQQQKKSKHTYVVKSVTQNMPPSSLKKSSSLQNKFQRDSQKKFSEIHEVEDTQKSEGIIESSEKSFNSQSMLQIHSPTHNMGGGFKFDEDDKVTNMEFEEYGVDIVKLEKNNSKKSARVITNESSQDENQTRQAKIFNQKVKKNQHNSMMASSGNVPMKARGSVSKQMNQLNATNVLQIPGFPNNNTDQKRKNGSRRSSKSFTSIKSPGLFQHSETQLEKKDSYRQINNNNMMNQSSFPRSYNNSPLRKRQSEMHRLKLSPGGFQMTGDHFGIYKEKAHLQFKENQTLTHHQGISSDQQFQFQQIISKLSEITTQQASIHSHQHQANNRQSMSAMKQQSLNKIMSAQCLQDDNEFEYYNEEQFEQFMQMMEFDKMNQFEFYFVHNNYNETILEYKKYSKKRLRKYKAASGKKKVGKAVNKFFLFNN